MISGAGSLAVSRERSLQVHMTPSIRRCRPDEDFRHLTALIHRAYAPLAARGMRYWATHQSVADTAERCGRGETWLAEAGGVVVGTITLQPPAATGGGPWYDRPDVAKFQQFAVEPAWQGRGVGAALMAHVEARALALGAAELALDTSERAAGLIGHYCRLGYRFIEHIDYRPDVNYRSVILSLTLDPRHRAAAMAPIGAHRGRPDTQIVQRPGWYQVITPSDDSGSLNEVLWGDCDPSEVDAIIAQTQATYAALSVPFKWCVWPWSRPADLGARLAASGMTSWAARGMSIAADAVFPSADVAVEPAELADYAAVWAEGWGEDPEKVAADVAAIAASGTTRLFVARIDGAAVGIAATRERPDAGYLLGAVVLPAWRGRGAYRALIAARLADLASRGIPLAVTHAREATSAPILEAMGFRTEFRYTVYFMPAG